MGFDFIVIGATGIQGKIVSKELLETGYSVLLCGRDKSRILPYLKKYKKCKFEYLDLRNIKETEKVLKKSGANVLVNCAESYWNIDILKACLKMGINSVDLGSEGPMIGEQLALHPQLKKKGIIHITGCGSVPGIGDVMLRYAAEKFDTLDTIHAGFAWNSNIKKFVVPFSIPTIIREMTLPATIIHNGRIKKVPKLSELQQRTFFKIGEQIIFLAPHAEEYTFDYYYRKNGLKNVKFFSGFPKHSFDTLQLFIELGFKDLNPIKIGEMNILPNEFLAQVLKKLEIPKGYKEKENLWIEIWGKKDGKSKKILMECIVPTLNGWEDAGCNIDTGMPASIMAQMIKNEIIKERGSFAPEAVIPPKLFFKELKKRKMIVYENEKQIN